MTCNQVASNHTLTTPLRKFGGARARRVVDAPGVRVSEHAHDWPVLSIYIAGSLENATEAGIRLIEFPWVVLYGSHAAHANSVGPNGFEQIEIEFDPDWLKLQGIRELRVPLQWTGGPVSRAGRDLARLWAQTGTSEGDLMCATQAFIAAARRAEQQQAPPWVATVLSRLRERPNTTAAELGSELGLNPHWVAQCYRAAMGEGIRETGRRTRVESAAALLRTTNLGAADIAAATGFCDQSYMIRCFLEVVGATPSQVKSEWRSLRQS